MQYMGSKNRLSKELLSVILKDRIENQYYVEPFLGGGNMIDKVTGNRIGNDKHFQLMELWKSLQNGWIPPTDVTKEYYYEVKKNQQYLDPALVGFVGFLCSFGGKWWGGYAANSKGDNYAERGSRVLVKQIENLKGVIFTNVDYWDMEIPPKSIIYCDPPYEGTTQYKDGFDHSKFWNWCRVMKNDGHIVYVSEYYAPEDFVCVKTLEHKTILDKNSQYPRIEKLFTLL